MIVGIPIMQLMLFGFAINSDPEASADRAARRRPQRVLAQHSSPRCRTAAISTSCGEAQDEDEADRMLAQRQRCSSSCSIPADFSRQLVRGERPAMLIEADATDPDGDRQRARGACNQLGADGAEPRSHRAARAARRRRRRRSSVRRAARATTPKAITQYNIVPGLMGVILTMTMVMMTALAITRERERGTMENLLATPARPLEVMIGKIVPYILVGYVQVTIILVARARFCSSVPMSRQPRRCSICRCCCSSPRISRSASRSRRSRTTSCRRCR